MHFTVAVASINSTCFIMFRVISEGRATQGKIAKRGNGWTAQRLLRVIAIIVTGPAAGVTTPAEPANGWTKQNWIFISDDNAIRSSPPLLCFPLQQALGSSEIPSSPSLSLSLSLSFLFISHLPLLLHLCHYCFECTHVRDIACAHPIRSLPTKRCTGFEYGAD